MDVDLVAAAFVRLPSPDSRRNALLALLPHLSAHEWRWLHSTTAARPFTCDLIARLPLELAALVFAYLDPAAPFRLARVSRRWHHVLRTGPLLTAPLRAWYRLPPSDYHYHSCRRQARQINAFRHAVQPYRCFALALALSLAHPTPDTASEPLLRHDTLIWPAPDHRSLCLLNLSAWSFRTLTAPARDTISHVCASSHLVAWTAKSTTCHVEPLDGNGPRKTFRVPASALFRALTCRQRTVACAGFYNGSAAVYIWNYDTPQGTSSSFNISLQSPLFPTSSQPQPGPPALHLLLQPDSSTIVVFVTGTDEHGGPPQVRHARYTYNGELLSNSTTLIHGLERLSFSGTVTGTSQLTPAGHDQIFSLQIHACEPGKPAPAQPFKLQFDEHLNRFTSPMHAVSKGRLWVHGSLGWWNDTFYQSLSSVPAHRRSTDTTGHVGTSDLNTDGPLLAADQHARGAGYIQVNDRYVVHPLDEAGFHVVCFDDESQAPHQSGPFFGVGTFRLLDADLSTR